MQGLVTRSYLEDIANAIRDKTGSQEEMTVAEMAAKIEAISGGVLTPYLKFYSAGEFEITAPTNSLSGSYIKTWDGEIEYSTDAINWTTWADENTELEAGFDGFTYNIYLRGTENTVVTGGSYSFGLNLVTASLVRCEGNIESLLDYQEVLAGRHPQMGNSCYQAMFMGWSALTEAPMLPATTLTNMCYFAMFANCTGLTKGPNLPATTLAPRCYTGMFDGCTGLTEAPELPATTLETGCYEGMFNGCTSLTTAPELPATTLASGCYSNMFKNCNSLTAAPELPATELATGCYAGMFSGTLLALSETESAQFGTPYRIPSVGSGIDAINAMTNMFSGQITTPTINTQYYSGIITE